MTNPFRESIRNVNLPELTQAIHVSDLLLLCLQHRQVLTTGQYDEILVRRFALFSSHYWKTLYFCTWVSGYKLIFDYKSTVYIHRHTIHCQCKTDFSQSQFGLGHTDKENSQVIISSDWIIMSQSKFWMRINCFFIPTSRPVRQNLSSQNTCRLNLSRGIEKSWIRFWHWQNIVCDYNL